MFQRHPIAPIMALILAAILAREARSQIIIHPADATAILIDTLELTMELPGDIEGEGEWATTVWLMSDNSTSLIIDLESISFTESEDEADELTLAIIVELAIQQSLEVVLQNKCSDSLESDGVMVVWTNGWGTRVDQGSETVFTVCGPALWGRQEYYVTRSSICTATLVSEVLDIGDHGTNCEPALDRTVSIQ